MTVLAVDPGNIYSAYCFYDGESPRSFGKVVNQELLDMIKADRFFGHLAIEYMHPRGMPTSKEEMDTQFFAGRVVEAWVGTDWDSETMTEEAKWTPIRRHDVKLWMCNSVRAKDKNIRQAVIDRFEPTGGGKLPQVGVKAKPGPLYGVSQDVWSALAIAITYWESQRNENHAG